MRWGTYPGLPSPDETVLIMKISCILLPEGFQKFTILLEWRLTVCLYVCLFGLNFRRMTKRAKFSGETPVDLKHHGWLLPGHTPNCGCGQAKEDKKGDETRDCEFKPHQGVSFFHFHPHFLSPPPPPPFLSCLAVRFHSCVYSYFLDNLLTIYILVEYLTNRQKRATHELWHSITLQ